MGDPANCHHEVILAPLKLMDSTRKSLLVRIRDKQDRTAWQTFYNLYAPMLYRYARRRGLSHHDAEEIRSQVLEIISRKIESYDYQPSRGRFRSWLRRLVVNKTIDAHRQGKAVAGGSHIEDAAAAEDMNAAWDMEWRNARLGFCLEQARSRTPQRAYQIFHLLIIEEKKVGDVSEIFDTTPNQIYKAKSLVMSEVRRALTEFDQEFAD